MSGDKPLNHYDIEVDIPIFHAESEMEARQRLIYLIARRGIRPFIRRIRKFEDQPVCPGYNEQCDGMWYEEDERIQY